MLSKNKTCVCVLLCVLVLSSCDSTNSDIRVQDFPEKVEVSGKPLMDIEIATKWANLVVVDTFLVVLKTEEPFISIYSTKSHELLCEIGEQGSGPNEFEMPTLLKQVSYDGQNKSPLIMLYDIVTRKVSNVNVLKAIENESDALFQERIPELNDILVYLYYKDDSLLVATPEGSGRFVMYNYADSRIMRTPFVPEYHVTVSDQAKRMIYRSFVAVNKNKNRFVAAPSYLNELNFFDLQGDYINSTIISSRDKLLPPSGKRILPSGIKRYFYSLESVGDKIYTLKTGPDEGKIQVFDWDGNALEQYTLEFNSRIGSFAYDQIHDRFYVYFPDEEPYNIHIYSLDGRNL